MPPFREFIRRKLSALRAPRVVPAQRCHSCAFVEFFRSNGDGQVTRLHTFCRCPGGPHEDRPIPPSRTCNHWQAASEPVQRPRVGDPNLTV